MRRPRVSLSPLLPLLCPCSSQRAQDTAESLLVRGLHLPHGLGNWGSVSYVS